MKCTNCGKELAPGAKFCNRCGTPVVQEQTEEGTYANAGQAFEGQENSPLPEGNKGPEEERDGAGGAGKKPFVWKDSYSMIAIVTVILVASVIGFVVRAQRQGAKEKEAAADSAIETTAQELFSEIVAETAEAGEESPVVLAQEAESFPLSEEETEAESSAAAKEEEASDYILPGSDSRFITEDELEGFSAEECRLARNELYARHGRKFDDAGLQEYFNSFDWYEPSIEPKDFAESMLNEYEIANRDLIVKYEEEQGYR